jgi:hypothetical protein
MARRRFALFSRVAWGALSLAGVLATAGNAESSLISITGGSFSGSIGFIDFHEFDSSLGTLDSVSVTLQGTLVIQGTTGVSLGAFGIPIPYDYSLFVEQDFFRGATDRGFEFSAPPARFNVVGQATGAGEPFVAAGAFNYSFSFTDGSDLLGGFTFPSFGSSFAMTPPGGVYALRDDFLPVSPVIIGLPIETVFTHLLTQASGVPFPALSVSASGALLVEYRYTPTTPPAVPEPATATVLTVALALLPIFGGERGRRRRG